VTKTIFWLSKKRRHCVQMAHSTVFDEDEKEEAYCMGVCRSVCITKVTQLYGMVLSHFHRTISNGILNGAPHLCTLFAACFLFFLALQPVIVVYSFQGFLITHNNAPQSVGLLWTSDQSVAETSA
jgi:hypothetical protein